jgi:hypothetical protein
MMSKKRIALWVVLVIAAAFITSQAYESIRGVTGLIKYDASKAYQGYTLVMPNEAKTIYLVDMEGYIVHSWLSQLGLGQHAILLENGNLLRAGRSNEQSPIMGGGVGGVIQEIDWDGKVVWEYKALTKTTVQHHTFCRLPNGNTMVLCWEKKTKEEALAKGRKPDTVKDQGLNPDFIQEVNRDGKVVWEWHVWDHIGTGPDQIDINYVLPSKAGMMAGADWTHYNTVEYMPETDQVILNSRNFSEFYVVNHKTGAIEFRWGNPCTSGQGKCPSWIDDGDQQLFGAHTVSHLENGNYLIFDNGWQRPEGNRSRIVELDPKSKQIVWQYAPRSANSLYAPFQGSAQRLPNGNTLVASATQGHIFEVTANRQIVWEFIVPTDFKGSATCFVEDAVGTIHRAYRYGKDFPAFKGKDLSKRRPFKMGCVELWRYNEPETSEQLEAAPQQKVMPKQKQPLPKINQAPKSE